MEGIKVGQYIRTKKGRIAKITTINEIKYTYHTAKARNRIKFVGQKRTLINGRYEFEDIKKHSSNIIDIIEVGDYVNGYKVSFKGNDYKPFVQCDYPVKQGTTNHYLFYEETIENIVTKEQFKSMKYEVI